MKSAILAVVAFVCVRLTAADTIAAGAHVINLKDLKFILWGNHGEGTKAAPSSGTCPLGKLPDGVFIHKTFQHKDHHFTLIIPVHKVIKKLICGNIIVWEGKDDEFLVEFHYFGKNDAKKHVHIVHSTKLGGLAHIFLEFAAGASPIVKVLGLSRFLAALPAAAFGEDFLKLKGLPASTLLHELALHVAGDIAAL